MKADISLLPNFLIIGAAKSGTTALFNRLSQHPEIFFPYKKELYFFNSDVNYQKGTQWYIESFFRDSEGYHCRGEATPGYLFWSDKVTARILETYHEGKPKFIAVFRDPVTRAYSAYWHLVHQGGEDLSFEDALAAEDERISSFGDDLNKSGFIKFAYFHGGCYATQLHPYLDSFSREQFFFLKSEDLQNNTADIIANIHTFLGVAPMNETIKSLPVDGNVSSKPRSTKIKQWVRQKSWLKKIIKPYIPAKKRYEIKQAILKMNMMPDQYPPMDPVIEAKLREKYQDEIESLENITALDLSGWK